MSTTRNAPTQAAVIRVLIVAGPLLWAILILFHPMPEGDGAFDGINDVVDRWLLVHVGQLILTPLLFLAVWHLLDGLTSTAARVSRCALVVWTVFFSAYDAVQGIATGVLVRHTNSLPTAEQDAIAGALDYLVYDNRLAGDISALQMVTGAAWLTVAIAAAVALHHANAGRAVVACACISTVFSAHVTPAAIGLVALFIACVLRERQRTDPRQPTPAAAPTVQAQTPGGASTHPVQLQA
jgi:hypothetical protein